MKGVIGRTLLPVVVLCIAVLPRPSHAQVANVVFTSDPQTVAPGVVSQQLTVQAQDGAGASVNIPQTACLSLTTTSAQGQFSSSATNWSPISVLTMNKSTANKNFYYQDTQAGTPTITVKVVLKPTDVSASCASWPLDQWNIQWTATQSITIGAGSASGGTDSSTSSNATASSSIQTQPTSSPAPTASYVAPPAPSLYADAGPDRTVIVGADTQFDARAYDRSKNVIDTARFLWNFGDGSTGEGESVLHHYQYPGRYALMLTIAQDKFAAMDEAVVTAEPAKLSFTALPDGGVEIDNLAERDLDLSDWLVRAGSGLFPALFTLPPHSVILSGSSMHIAKATLGFTATAQAELQYPNGVEVLQAGETTSGAVAPVPAAAPAPIVAAVPRAAAASKTPDYSADVSAEDVQTSDATISTTTGQSASVGAASSGYSSNMWWIAAIVLALAAGGALVAAQRLGKKEWDIVEEK